jgi:hypothetical protein
VTATYRYVDAWLRKHQAGDIVLAMVAGVDTDTALQLRAAGGELWYCGPSDTPAADSPSHADRQLLAESWHELSTKTHAALADFLGKAPVPA